MASPASRNQRGYVQKESTWGTIPAAGGVASVAATDAFLMVSLDMTPTQPVNDRPDKTGSLSQVVGTPGRRSATWSMRLSAAGSGSAGTPPDIDVILASIFGKDSVAVAATSVTYALEDACPSMTIWDFNALAAGDQQCTMGAICTRARFEFGGDFAFLDLSGESKWVLRKDNYANEDTTAKSGLNAYPSEPANPTTSGSSVAGYKGTITLDGNTYSTMRNGSIEIIQGGENPKDTWGSDYPAAAAPGMRQVNVAFSIYDDDSANFLAFKNKASNKTAVNVTFAIGATAGNIWTFTLKNILFDAPKYTYDAVRRAVDFKGTAKATGLATKDEVTLVLT